MPGKGAGVDLGAMLKVFTMAELHPDPGNTGLCLTQTMISVQVRQTQTGWDNVHLGRAKQFGPGAQ